MIKGGRMKTKCCGVEKKREDEHFEVSNTNPIRSEAVSFLSSTYGLCVRDHFADYHNNFSFQDKITKTNKKKLIRSTC